MFEKKPEHTPVLHEEDDAAKDQHLHKPQGYTYEKPQSYNYQTSPHQRNKNVPSYAADEPTKVQTLVSVSSQNSLHHSSSSSSQYSSSGEYLNFDKKYGDVNFNKPPSESDVNRYGYEYDDPYYYNIPDQYNNNNMPQYLPHTSNTHSTPDEDSADKYPQTSNKFQSKPAFPAQYLWGYDPHENFQNPSKVPFRPTNFYKPAKGGSYVPSKQNAKPNIGDPDNPNYYHDDVKPVTEINTEDAFNEKPSNYRPFVANDQRGTFHVPKPMTDANGYQGQDNQKVQYQKPIVTESLGPNGQRITSIITEISNGK